MDKESWNFFTESVFSFVSTPIKVNRENIKEIILSLDEVIIKAGFRYELYQLAANHLLFDKDNISLTYKSDRLKEFWVNRRGENIFSLLQMHQWSKFINFSDFELNLYPRSIISFREEDSFKKKYYLSSSNSNPAITVYSNNIVFDNSDTEDLELYIESYCDVWYDKISDTSKMNNVIGNKVNAYLNTPKLNSFLREIERELNRLGASIKKDTEGNLYNTDTIDNRILLNGKIIYQEDIDEGQVKFPDLPYPA